MSGPTEEPARLPLRGVRVITLGQQLPGPFAAALLADLGADVILVEHPDRPDPTRRFPGYYAAVNRNQRAVALDLKDDEHRAALFDLVATADVFIEGFRPGVAERLGIGETELHGVRPELVYVSISSYGRSGPLGDAAGHDISIQARAGLLGGEGEPLTTLPLADLAASMYATVGILAALYGRRTGESGSTLDVAMLDSLLAWRGMSLGPLAYALITDRLLHDPTRLWQSLAILAPILTAMAAIVAGLGLRAYRACADAVTTADGPAGEAAKQHC